MGLSVQISISVRSCRKGRESPPFLQLSQPIGHPSLGNTVPGLPGQASHLYLCKWQPMIFTELQPRPNGTLASGRGSHQHRGDIGTFPGKWGRHTACMSDSCQLQDCFFPASLATSSLTVCAWRTAALGPGPDDIITLPPASHSSRASISHSFPSLSALWSSAHCVHFWLLL